MLQGAGEEWYKWRDRNEQGVIQHGIGNIPDDDPDHIIAIQHRIGNIPDDGPDHIIAIQHRT
jgi:hypothetical protein